MIKDMTTQLYVNGDNTQILIANNHTHTHTHTHARSLGVKTFILALRVVTVRLLTEKSMRKIHMGFFQVYRTKNREFMGPLKIGRHGKFWGGLV